MQNGLRNFQFHPSYGAECCEDHRALKSWAIEHRADELVAGADRRFVFRIDAMGAGFTRNQEAVIRPSYDAAAKSRALISFFEVKKGIELTAVLKRPKLIPPRQGAEMVIELVLLFVFAVAVGVAVVKVIEWRLDVLYGPYIARGRAEQKARTRN